MTSNSHIVFRVEDSVNGRGPYNNPRNIDIVYFLHAQHNLNPKRTPCIFEDGVSFDKVRKWINSQERFRCGFDSMESLNRWFSPHFSLLKKAGFVIVHYEVNECDLMKLDHQVIFSNFTDILKIEQIPLGPTSRKNLFV